MAEKREVSSGLKKEDLGLRIAGHVVLIIFSLMALIPFLILLSSSLMSTETIAKYGYSIFPRDIDFAAYTYLFKAWSLIGRAYLITIGVTVIGVVLSMLFTSMLAFGLAWDKTPGKRIVMVMLLITMLFNGGAVSTYVIYSNIFHMDDSFWSLIIPNLLMNAFTVFLFISYFRSTISKELMEAAQLDGANMFIIYFRIYMPLALPIIATMGLSSAIAYWNDWNNSLYYISAEHQELYSIQRLLREMQESVKFIQNNPNLGLSTENLPSATVQMAIAVIGILPIIIAYPFFQKYFVAGISLGGVKG